MQKVKHLELYKETLKTCILAIGLIFSTIVISLPASLLLTELPEDKGFQQLILENQDIGVLFPVEEVKLYGEIRKIKTESEFFNRIKLYMYFVFVMVLIMLLLILVSFRLSNFIDNLENGV